MKNKLENYIDFLRVNSDFIIPIILGIFQKLVLLFLVLIPIQALRSVSRGIISRKFRLFFQLFNLSMPSSSSETIIFFIKLFIIFIFSLFIIKKLNNYFLETLKTRRIKKHLHNENLDNKFDLRKTNNIIRVESRRIDLLISIISSSVFLIIMISSVIAIDPAIGLMLIIGGLINYRALSYYAKKLNEEKREKIGINKNYKNMYKKLTENDLDKYINKKINNKITDSKAFTKQLLNAFVILSIMLLIFFRDGPQIGFLFIILMRLSLNNLNKGIETLVRYRMKIFDDPEDQVDFG